MKILFFNKSVRMSDTAIFFKAKKYQTAKENTYYYFDITKVADSSKGLVELEDVTEVVRLSDTTAVLLTKNTSYFFDTKSIGDSSKGLVKLENATRVGRLSDTTAIFGSPDTSYFFDAKKINDENKGLIDLGKKSINIKERLSDTTAIVGSPDFWCFFDAKNVSDSSKGLVELSIRDDEKDYNVTRMSNNTAIFTNYKYGSLEIWDTYFFDATKINDLNHGFTNLEKEHILLLDKLSDTTAIFAEITFDSSFIFFEFYFFDVAKINQPKKRFVPLNKKVPFLLSSPFFAMPLNTGFFQLTENNEVNTYFFDAAKINDDSRGLKNLNFDKNVNAFVFSDVLAIFKESKTNKAYLFDRTKINSRDNGIFDLNQTMSSFYQMTDNTGIFNCGETSYYFEYN